MLKYIPTGSSRIIPAHWPDANSVSPRNATLPFFPAASTLSPTAKPPLASFSSFRAGGLSFEGGFNPDDMSELGLTGFFLFPFFDGVFGAVIFALEGVFGAPNRVIFCQFDLEKIVFRLKPKEEEKRGVYLKVIALIGNHSLLEGKTKHGKWAFFVVRNLSGCVFSRNRAPVM